MNVRRDYAMSMVAALAAVVTTLGVNQALAAAQGRANPEQGVGILTRGPVHEAFAATIT